MENKATSSKPKADPSLLPKPTEPLVIDSFNCGMENFPSTAGAAQRGVEKLIQDMWEQGYKYAGPIHRKFGLEQREFFVFNPR